MSSKCVQHLIFTSKTWERKSVATPWPKKNNLNQYHFYCSSPFKHSVQLRYGCDLTMVHGRYTLNSWVFSTNLAQLSQLCDGCRLNHSIWVNYSNLPATEPWESLLNKENHSNMALIQLSELL